MSHQIREMVSEQIARRAFRFPEGTGALTGPLNDVARYIEKYMVMSSHAAIIAVTLWIAHAWVFDAFDITPYLLVKSPTKRSGKSLLLKILKLLLPKPWLIFSPSEAVLFRKIARDCPQVLIDESDPIFKGRIEQHEPLRALLNAGFERGAPVPRVNPRNLQLEEFEVFCPKALATIGDLPDTIEDRSVIISMKRASLAEKHGLARFRRREAREEAVPIRDALSSWAAAGLPKLREARPVIPDKLDARAADIWEPLLAVAEVAGDGWAGVAWEAALTLSGVQARQDEELGVRLLTDLKQIFDSRDVDQVATSALIQELIKDETAPWGDWRGGKPFTPHALGRLLRPFGIAPDKWRDSLGTVRGYNRASFEDAWSRYIPTLSLSDVSQPPQPPRPLKDAETSQFLEPPHIGVVADTKNVQTSLQMDFVADVADQTPVEVGRAPKEPSLPPLAEAARRIFDATIISNRRARRRTLRVRPTNRWRCASTAKQVRRAVDLYRYTCAPLLTDAL